MTQLTRLLQANEGYASARANISDPRPTRQLAVVTCMDARIDVFVIGGFVFDVETGTLTRTLHWERPAG